jgi:putative transposase
VPDSIWHVTMDTLDRRPVFANPLVARIADRVLRDEVRHCDGRLLLYCVMPDHVHAVIQVGSVELISVIRSYKAYVSRRCEEQHLPTKFWQPRFHDRGIRESDNLDELIKYITGNPVKAGHVSTWEEYPWIGGDLLSRA